MRGGIHNTLTKILLEKIEKNVKLSLSTAYRGTEE
jgi:hypothetical protein